MEDVRHEHRAPATVFSVEAFSQVQLRADCFPHEPGSMSFKIQNQGCKIDDGAYTLLEMRRRSLDQSGRSRMSA